MEQLTFMLHDGIRVRKESFGSILIIPPDLERPDIPQFFKLNKLGTLICELSHAPISLTTLVEKLTANSLRHINKAEEIEHFVGKLLQIGILENSKYVKLEHRPIYDEKRKTLIDITPLSFPLSAFIELTDQCVLQCMHCYTKSKRIDPYFIDRNDWTYQLLTELINFGVMTLGFGGGEPTLDPNLSNYISYCTAKSVKTAISTSGVLIHRNYACKLKDAGLGIAQISMDGPKDIHEKLRGKSTFEKMLTSLRIFSEVGVETRVAMTVTSINYRYIEETSQIAFNNGADRFVVFRYMPSSFCGEQISLDQHELKFVAETLIAIENKHPETRVGYEALCFYPHLLLNEYAPAGRCNAGRDLLNICADGTVTPCPHMRNYKLGAYPKENLQKIWEKSIEFCKTFLAQVPVECDGCDFLDKCAGGCCSDLSLTDIRRAKDKMCWR